MVNKTNLKCCIQAYNIKIKKKRLHTYENVDSLYYILKDISSKTYSVIPKIKDKRQSIDGHDFAMDLLNCPQEKDDAFMRIDFIFGRETYENFPLKKKNGTKDTWKLPDDSNICFDTHGSFLFKKVNDEWSCILLIERRFHTASFGKIIEYIQKFYPSFVIENDPITTETNYIRKINTIKNLRAIIIKNREFRLRTEEGAGTFFAKSRENQGDEVSKIQIELKEGNSPYERFIDFFKRHSLIGSGGVNNAKLRNLINENGLVLVRSLKKGETGSRYIPLGDDFIIYNISVLYEPELRRIDDADFFTKLFIEVTEQKINRMFELSRKLDNHSQEE